MDILGIIAVLAVLAGLYFLGRYVILPRFRDDDSFERRRKNMIDQINDRTNDKRR